MRSIDHVLSRRFSPISCFNGTRGHFLLVALLMSRMFLATGCAVEENGQGAYSDDDASGSSAGGTDGTPAGGTDGTPAGGTDGASDGGTEGSSTWEGEAYRYEYVVESYSETGLDQSYGISIDTQGSKVGCFSTESEVDSDGTISDSDKELVWEAFGAVAEEAGADYYACHSHCKEYPVLYSAGIIIGDDSAGTMQDFGWEQGSYAPHALWDLGTLSESLIAKYCGISP